MNSDEPKQYECPACGRFVGALYVVSDPAKSPGSPVACLACLRPDQAFDLRMADELQACYTAYADGNLDAFVRRLSALQPLEAALVAANMAASDHKSWRELPARLYIWARAAATGPKRKRRRKP